MRQQHIQVALVHGHIGGLAHRAARMVQPFRHIAQLHEFLEILHRGIAAPAFGVAHERRAVDRRQNQVAPADLDRFAGFRACWMKLAGASGTSWRASPRGICAPVLR
jgi:hypothetical protein